MQERKNNISILCGKKMHAYSPGRVEVAGNHLDHQHGITITSSIEDGIHADIIFNDSREIKVHSEGFLPFSFNIDEAIKAKKNLDNFRYTPQAIVMGVVCEFAKRNIEICGFEADIISTLPIGMGVSSSASFELLFAVIFNKAFCDNKLSQNELAVIAYNAEVNYYGKPCGILDQTAIAYGGLNVVDFKDIDNLKVENIDFSFEDAGIGAVLVNSEIDHSKGHELFSTIPDSMIEVANRYNVDYLRNLDFKKYWEGLNDTNAELGNKVTLKSAHFYHVLNIVENAIKALKKKDVRQFINLHMLTGFSSAVFLQNLIISDHHQEAAYCQAVCELALDLVCENNFENRGASRIHGGGFGGCVEVFLPLEQIGKFMNEVNGVYGKNVCREVKFSEKGANAKWVDENEKHIRRDPEIYEQGIATFVIPNYAKNFGENIEFLNKTLNSVREQTDKNWQVVIVDDASPCKQAKDLIKHICENDNRFHAIFLQENCGPGEARNWGIRFARSTHSPIILFLDNDDIAHKDRLKVCRKHFVEDPDINVVYSTFSAIDENDNVISPSKFPAEIREVYEGTLHDVVEGENAWIKIATDKNYINYTSTTAVRTDLAYITQFPKVYVSEDTHTWLRYGARRGKFKFDKSIPMLYRIPQNLDMHIRATYGDFNKTKVQNDTDGFMKATQIALENGNIKIDQLDDISIGFYVKLAQTINIYGSDDLAKELIEKANIISKELTQKYMKKRNFSL